MNRFFLVLFFLSNTTHAETLTWKGGYSSWFNPENWSGNKVPTAETDIFVPETIFPTRTNPYQIDYTIRLSGNVNAVSGQVDARSPLNLSGGAKLTSSGTVHTLSSDVRQGRTVEISNRAEWNIRTGDLRIIDNGNSSFGSVSVSMGGVLNLEQGSIFLGGNSSLTVYDGTLNASSIEMDSEHYALIIANYSELGSDVIEFSIRGKGSVDIVGDRMTTYSGASDFAGLVSLRSQNLIFDGSFDNPELDVYNYGKIRGKGSFAGHVESSGFITAGSQIGTLSFDGDLKLLDSATTEITLGVQEFSGIPVDGMLTFDGKLSLLFEDDFLPQIGDTFSLFSFDPASATGQFDQILFDIHGVSGDFDYQTGELTITAIPEPSIFGALGLGVSFLLVSLLCSRYHAS